MVPYHQYYLETSCTSSKF